MQRQLACAALGRVTQICGHQWDRWFFRIYPVFEALSAKHIEEDAGGDSLWGLVGRIWWQEACE